MTGVQDTISFRDGGSATGGAFVSTPSEILTPTTTASISGAIETLSRSAERLGGLDSPGASSLRRKRVRKDSSVYSNSPGITSKSWNEGGGSGLIPTAHVSKALSGSFSSSGYGLKKGGSSRLTPNSTMSYMGHGKKVVVFESPAEEMM